MIIVLATIDSTEETVDALHDAVVAMQEGTATEEGSISYTFAREIARPNVIRVIEQWRSMDDLKAHFLTPHMAEFQAEMARHPQGALDVHVYDVAGELPFPSL